MAQTDSCLNKPFHWYSKHQEKPWSPPNKLPVPKKWGAPLPAVVFVGGSWYVFGSKMLTPEQLDGSLKLWLSNKCLMEIQWPWLWSTLPKKNLDYPENRPSGKGDSDWKPPFFGAMLVLGSVVLSLKKPSVQSLGKMMTNYWQTFSEMGWNQQLESIEVTIQTIAKQYWTQSDEAVEGRCKDRSIVVVYHVYLSTTSTSLQGCCPSTVSNK